MMQKQNTQFFASPQRNNGHYQIRHYQNNASASRSPQPSGLLALPPQVTRKELNIQNEAMFQSEK